MPRVTEALQAVALDPDSSPARNRVGVLIKLSLMMFLQYAVWGLWLPILASYLGSPATGGGLGFSPAQIGWILGLAGAIGAVAAPFIAGQAADRYMNAERALGLLLLIGGGVNLALAYTTGYMPFLLLSIAYSVVYMPTLSLTNSIAFSNLRDPEKTFPPVRLWGTIGWMVASILFTTVWLNYEGNRMAAGITKPLPTWTAADADGSFYDSALPVEHLRYLKAKKSDDIINTSRIADALEISGIVSILYGLYAFALLPKTPPKPDAADPLAFMRAFSLLRHPAFLIATLVALPIAMIHQVYFFRAAPFFETVGVSKDMLGPVLTIGQFSEIFFLLILGFFIKRLGYKWVLVLGAAAYAARFGLFALGGPEWLMIGAQLLHGLCYGCFFAGAFLLVEKIAGPDVRHSAQTVFGIIILGVGPILAGFYNQLALGQFDRSGTTNYHGVWGVQAAVALAAMVVLIAIFPKRLEPDVAPRGFDVQVR